MKPRVYFHESRKLNELKEAIPVKKLLQPIVDSEMMNREMADFLDHLSAKAGRLH